MTTRTAALAPLAAAALLCAACDTVPQDAITSCSSEVTPGGGATDILFVIDDSSSMLNDQTTLKTGLYDFIQALASSPVANDVHVGVTTTSIVQWYDTQTQYAAGPSAGLPYAAGTIVAIARDGTGAPIAGEFVWQGGAYAGERILSTSSMGAAAFQSAFEANVLVSENGSNREMPFKAARLALEKAGPGGVNDGFLRPGARLAIVFLSDEDDCSGDVQLGDLTGDNVVDSADCRAAKTGNLLTPVSDVAAFLQGPIGGEVKDVVVAAIVGVAPGTLVPSCAGSWCTNHLCSTATDQGTRFVELLGHFAADHKVLGSICDSNFAAALAGLADAIMPDTIALDGAPADYRMLVVSLDRASATIPCTVAEAGSSGAGTADAVYTQPQAGRPATLMFQNACALQRGDQVKVSVICAG